MSRRTLHVYPGTRFLAMCALRRNIVGLKTVLFVDTPLIHFVAELCGWVFRSIPHLLGPQSWAPKLMK
jgi:hypothetical protein